MPNPTETVLEIDLNALAHNYRYLRSKIAAGTQFMAVVKAFAYGSDAVQIAKKLESLGVNFFAVAYVQEGINLRKGGITQPILVLHPQSVHFGEIIDNCLTPAIYSKLTLTKFIATAEKQGQKNYPFHLKLNTGLNRLGFSEAELGFVGNALKNTQSAKLEGIYSHLAASEDPAETDFSKQQIERFEKMTAQLLAEMGHQPLLHLCNTSGILNFPQAHFDLVRSGIGLYGFGNSAEEDAQLEPVATLKTIISQIHHLKRGESVGYNRAFKAEKPTTTATLPLGHADGINRIYGRQKTAVAVNGKLAPILGNVCMDMLMIDITGIDCREGDEVILFGKDKSAKEFANSAGTISYELITSISQRVKRIVKGT